MADRLSALLTDDVARKARRAWGLAERNNQLSIFRPADSELARFAMLEGVAVVSVRCRLSCARRPTVSGGGQGLAISATNPCVTGHGVVTAAISNAMVRLLHRYTGRGPTRAGATIDHGIIVCVRHEEAR
jgi:hypothetical protein